MAERTGPSANGQVTVVEGDTGIEPDNSGKTRGLDKALVRIRSNRVGRIALRITVTILGALTIVVGLVLVPLPGPGWLIVFGGLAIWSIEFRWARRLNRFVRRQVGTWTRWYARQGWPTRIIVGFLTLILVIAIITGSIYISVGSSGFRWLPGVA